MRKTNEPAKLREGRRATAVGARSEMCARDPCCSLSLYIYFIYIAFFEFFKDTRITIYIYSFFEFFEETRITDDSDMKLNEK